MSQVKPEDPVKKRQTKPQGEEEVKSQQKTSSTSKSEDKKSQGAQPSGGSKAGWLVGGSVLILVLALLYTRNVEEGALKKDHHPVRETEQTQTKVPEHDADYKGFVYVEEKWKNVFRVDKVGSAVTLHSLRCTSSGAETYDDLLPKVVQDIGEHLNVKNFTLASPMCKSITDRGFTGLAENLGKYLTKVESLEFTFLELGLIGDASIKSLVTSIGQNLHSLQHLSLTFTACNGITGESVSSLAKAMDQFPRSFKNFTLNVYFVSKVTSSSVIELSESLARNFPKLTNLKFAFRMVNSLTNTVVGGLANSISSLKELESLSLLFGMINNVGTHELEAITHNIAGLTKLKSLELAFQKAKLDLDSMAIMGKALANYNSLTDLILDFSACTAIFDDGIKALTDGFKGKLPKLKSLSLLLFGITGITDEGAKEIASIISEERKGLEEFSINLSYSDKVTGVGIIALANNIEKNLHNLKKFKLALPSSDTYDDEVVMHIAAIFSPKLASLRELGVIFKGSKTLTDAGVSVLADNIGNNLINLEKLNLEFNAHAKLGDIGTVKIAEAIRKRLSKLQELELRLAELDISPFAIAGVIDSLAQHRQDLKVLSLGFEALRQITDDLVNQLTNVIGTHLRGVEKLTIAFTLTNLITNKSVKHVENMVLANNLPKLRDLNLKCNKAYKVKNAALGELAINIAQNVPSINNLLLGFPQKFQDSEKHELVAKTKAIPYVPIS